MMSKRCRTKLDRRPQEIRSHLGIRFSSECRCGNRRADSYSTPAMAASTASISAPKSRPSEAAPAPGEALAQPGPFAWQSLGFLLTVSLRSRMPAASGDATVMFPLGNDPRPTMIRFLSKVYGSKQACRTASEPCPWVRDAQLWGPPPAEATGGRRSPTENTLLVTVKFGSFASAFRTESRTPVTNAVT